MSDEVHTTLAYARPEKGRSPAGWWIIGSALVAALVVAPLGKRWRSKPGRPGKPCVTLIHAVDAQTGSPLPIRVGGPPTGGTDPWSMTFTTTGDLSRMRLNWKDVDDVPVRVSSQGYAEQVIVLDSRTPRTVVVRLQKQ